MNTFGASAYLKAEKEAVEETLQTLRDRLKKLKIEELSIRSEIRLSMAAATASSSTAGTAAGDWPRPDLPHTPLHQGPSGEGRNAHDSVEPQVVWEQNLDPRLRRQYERQYDEMAVNQAPLELDINQALTLINRCKSGEHFGDSEELFGRHNFSEAEEEEEEEEEGEGEDGEQAEEYGDDGDDYHDDHDRDYFSKVEECFDVEKLEEIDSSAVQSGQNEAECLLDDLAVASNVEQSATNNNDDDDDDNNQPGPSGERPPKILKFDDTTFY